MQLIAYTRTVYVVGLDVNNEILRNLFRVPWCVQVIQASCENNCWNCEIVNPSVTSKQWLKVQMTADFIFELFGQ